MKNTTTIYKWRGTKNSDTNIIDGGYLWVKQPKESKFDWLGHQIHNVTTRKEAIEKFEINLVRKGVVACI